MRREKKNFMISFKGKNKTRMSETKTQVTNTQVYRAKRRRQEIQPKDKVGNGLTGEERGWMVTGARDRRERERRQPGLRPSLGIQY